MALPDFQGGQWKLSLIKQGLLNTAQHEALSVDLSNVKLPDMIYGNSSLVLTNEASNLRIEFNAKEALRLCSFAEREARLHQEGNLNELHIHYLPTPLKVSAAKYWEGRTMPVGIFATGDDERIPIPESTLYSSDWTYTTPYKGSLTSLQEGTPLVATLQVSDEEIPLTRLGRDNPILWGGEIVLYEDELDDCGSSRCFLRVRAMADCFFVLFRHYLRVDDVIVRLCDTRLFHSYDSQYILREYQVKEAPYSAVMQALPRTWTTDANQSDMVFYVTQPLQVFRDKLAY
mmetsp:Transcript_7601/g.14259  ORF Transcript_7601/g.14259 Transcript_7601/m.14259 type:complete len:288 (-) Transcript_7601:143-1006(-)